MLEAGDGDDVARLGALDRHAFEAAEGEQLGEPAFLDEHAVAPERLDRHVEPSGARMDASGEHPAEIRIILERARQHGEGAARIGLGRRDVGDDELEERGEALARPLEPRCRPALAARCEEHREIELRLRGVEGREEIEDLLVHLVRARVGPVAFVDQHDRAEAEAERLGEHELGLRQRPLGRVHQHDRTVHHVEDALDLAAEVGVPRRVDDVEAHAAPGDRGAFGEDGDAALALEVVRIHRPLRHRLMGAHGTAFPEQDVDERRLAVVDVRDDREVADVHGMRLLLTDGEAPPRRTSP